MPMICLNAPFGARCFLTRSNAARAAEWRMGLNAPFGARCFLTRLGELTPVARNFSLNAPFGARCFLTDEVQKVVNGNQARGLNAPFGARCFLTGGAGLHAPADHEVLMHLLALGAF